MAGRMVRSCLQSLLKAMNCVMAVVGIAMILYGLWMIRVWLRDMGKKASFYSTAPWFIYAFLGLGMVVCLLACIGYIAADSANGFCLSCNMVLISLLVLFEIAVSADILLNSDWEKDLPEDPTGRFADFEHFVDSNWDVFKWITLLIALTQGLSILLSMVLRSTGSHSYDSEDYDQLPAAKLPLLHHPPPPPPHPYIVKGDPHFDSIK